VGTRKGLTLWTIYHNPSDYPGKYVARRFVVERGLGLKAAREVLIADTLEAIRARLPPGLYCLGRQPGDEPQIVETWI